MLGSRLGTERPPRRGLGGWEKSPSNGWERVCSLSCFPIASSPLTLLLALVAHSHLIVFRPAWGQGKQILLKPGSSLSRSSSSSLHLHLFISPSLRLSPPLKDVWVPVQPSGYHLDVSCLQSEPLLLCLLLYLLLLLRHVCLYFRDRSTVCVGRQLPAGRPEKVSCVG